MSSPLVTIVGLRLIGVLVAAEKLSRLWSRIVHTPVTVLELSLLVLSRVRTSSPRPPVSTLRTTPEFGMALIASSASSFCADIQITGYGDFTRINVQAGDAGGNLDCFCCSIRIFRS